MTVMKLVQLIVTAAFLAYLGTAQAEEPQAAPDESWEIRYLLFISPVDSRKISTTVSSRFNNNADKKSFLLGEALFQSFAHIAIPRHPGISVVLISFDKNGRVRSPHLQPGKWVASINNLGRLVLRDETGPLLPYHVAKMDQGMPGQPAFSPAVCDQSDADRYDDGSDPDMPSGAVGCREWTAQLYDAERPYIDVTTYSSSGALIGELVGWSRFEDPTKPVIGKQGKIWLCLHECPAGEHPGIIGDIKKWVRKHGYPWPERPAKQPQFPNSDYKDSWEE